MMYSVLIRILGTAGEKYLQTFWLWRTKRLSLKKIYIAITHRYENPKETLGIETIIHTSRK